MRGPASKPKVAKPTMQMVRPSLADRAATHRVHTAPKTSPSLSPDMALGHDLVLLLSKLEFLRVQLGTLKNGKQFEQALPCLRHMLEAAQLVADTNLEADAAAEPRRAAAELTTALEELQKDYQPSSLTRLVGLFRKAELTSKQKKAFRKAANHCLEVLADLFDVFGSRFAAPAAAEEWAQTAQVFQAQLRCDVDQLVA